MGLRLWNLEDFQAKAYPNIPDYESTPFLDLSLRGN